MTLTMAQRERIVSHIEHGWKLPDSLILELWEAYKELEESHVPSNARSQVSNGKSQQPLERVELPGS